MTETQETPIKVPADVPDHNAQEYLKNMTAVTHGTGKILLFAGDQKVEHLNDDYVGEGADPEDADPEHLFKIACETKATCFASQLELIARYGKDYSNVPYLIKLNSKSNIIPDNDKDPISLAMVTMEQVKQFRDDSGLNIVGVGYTVYLGSEFEAEMFREAENAILQAHQLGMIAIIWMYPRGKHIANKLDPHLIAGAAGVAASLGADFVKVNYPELSDTKDMVKRARAFKEAVSAAGRTKVICSGGEKISVEEFLEQLWNQINISGTFGCAIGRNLHQRSLEEAKRFVDAIDAIIYREASAAEAIAIYKQG
jgi:fructose-bisphosphate aldolase/6-deoxy-5-ketofructose 1-phosphate synthase